MVWKELRIYIKLEWLKLRTTVNEGRKLIEEAFTELNKRFGSSNKIYTIMEGQVEIALLAPN